MNYEKMITEEIKVKAKKDLYEILKRVFKDMETISIVLIQINEQNAEKLVRIYSNQKSIKIKDIFTAIVRLLEKQGLVQCN